MERKKAGTLVQVQDSMWMPQKKNGKRITECTPTSPRNCLPSLQRTSKWQVTKQLSWGTGNHIRTFLFCSFHFDGQFFSEIHQSVVMAEDPPFMSIHTPCLYIHHTHATGASQITQILKKHAIYYCQSLTSMCVLFTSVACWSPSQPFPTERAQRSCRPIFGQG